MIKAVQTGSLMVLIFLAFSMVISAQGKYLTHSGTVRFYSHTAIEDITAENNSVSSVIDAATGELVIIIRMTEFKFKKKLMQEHFNENYVESETFAKATFKGRIVNNADVDYSSKGVYRVEVEGEFNLHGVSNMLSTEGTLEVNEKGILARTKFLLNPEDFDIKIPGVIRKNISEHLEITAELSHRPI